MSVITVPIDFDLTFLEMMRRAGFTYASPHITAANFPVVPPPNGGVVEVKMEVVRYPVMSPTMRYKAESVHEFFRKRGFITPEVVHALGFAAHCPSELQRVHILMVLGARFVMPQDVQNGLRGHKHMVCLSGRESTKTIDVMPIEGGTWRGWDGNVAFLAVHPEPTA